ncbi:hypothetical protein MRX96_003625 [Rhipicephalus microplus]
MNYNRNQQRPGNVINGAQAVNPQAANHNPLNHVAAAKYNPIQSLRNENDQLNLYDETMDAGYQLLNDPNAPTRNETSSQRDTNPDLAFISMASALRGVTWRNTGEGNVGK